MVDIEAAGHQAALTLHLQSGSRGREKYDAFTSALFSPGLPAWEMFPPIVKVGLSTSIDVVKIIRHKLAQGHVESL